MCVFFFSLNILNKCLFTINAVNRIPKFPQTQKEVVENYLDINFQIKKRTKSHNKQISDGTQ
jgi:hypothetical protein